MADPESEETDEGLLKAIAWLIEHGAAFDWLAEEPEIYTANDGEPV